MWGWIIGATVAVIAGVSMFSASSSEEAEGDDESGGDESGGDEGGGFGVGNSLPISGRDLDECPGAMLPPPSGSSTGFDALPDEVYEGITSFRELYEGPLSVTKDQLGSMTKDVNADICENLALQAECAGYYDVAKALYAKAAEIRSWVY